MERDTIIVVEGGAMLGVFGMGVFTAFQEADLYPRIHSIYAASAGAHDAAFFLARQTRMAGTVYYDDLSGRQFIRPRRFFCYLAEIILFRLFKRPVVNQVVDLDYLIDVESSSKALDIAAILHQLIPLNVTVYNINTHAIEYLIGKNNTMLAIKASSSSPPYYANPITVCGQRYIDSGFANCWDTSNIIKENPDKRIIYIINNSKHTWFTVFALPYIIFEALLLAVLFGFRVGWVKLRNIFKYPTCSELAQYKNVTVVSNNTKILHNVTDRNKLLQLYNYGIEEGKRALATLNKVKI